MQYQIINRSNPTETQTGEAATTPVHQRPAGLAEGAGHGVACVDCGIGRVGGEVVETADVIQRGGFDRDLWDGVIFLFGVWLGWILGWLEVMCLVFVLFHSTGMNRSLTFEANIVAVTLRQSEQWQTWMLTKSSPSTGCVLSKGQPFVLFLLIESPRRRLLGHR
jgi:hypothetical protein